MGAIVVVEYDDTWPATFERLRRHVWPLLADVATSVEHVGSTSIPGLAAKPVIDMSVVVPTVAEVPVAIGRLATLGYLHQGNLGVEEREAFRSPASLPRHHLYLCPSQSLALRNHRLLRDYLRAHPEAARRYGELKKRLACADAADRDAYTAGKTDFILDVLGAAGVGGDELETIARINRRPEAMP